MIGYLLAPKIILMLGLGSWMGIACANNRIDCATNRQTIGNMVTMHAIKQDNTLGVGLLHRAWKNHRNVSPLLWSIVCLQGIIAFTFLLAGILLSAAIFQSALQPLGLLFANVALWGFDGLWLGFLCGGLWFGYWIHMSQVQATHLLLLMIGLLSSVLINVL